MAKETKEIECIKCKTKFLVELPRPEITNKITFSAVMLVHERTEECPGCHQQYLYIVQTIEGAVFGFVPVDVVDKSGSGLVEPPPGFDISKLPKM